jgi:hypothetical protein
MYSENSQDCVVLAFKGCQVNVLCSLPDKTASVQAYMPAQMGEVIPIRAFASPPELVEETRCGGKSSHGMVEDCLDIGQNAATINKAILDIKELAREFAEIVRKYDY